MKATKAVSKLACAAGVAVLLLMVTQAGATIAYNTPSTTLGNQGSDGAWNLGEQFTVNSAVTVTSLGAFDSGLDGFGTASITVAIYNITVPGLVGSVVLSGTSGTLAAGSSYRFLPVTPFNLDAGSTYMVVASGLGTPENPDWNAFYNGQTTLITTDTGGGLLSFNSSWYSQFTGTPALPNLGPDVNVAQYGAGSFEFAPVPEASQFAIAGVGLLGLVYVGRCVYQRRKGVA